ncbi:MAG: DUF2806 domain-containing protein [Albidovulum sp.]|nr:DUF2806 domain-containing protein [Albidovulum sp.]
MNSDDHLSREVGVEARITNSGLSANAKSRAFAAIDRFLGSLMDVPASTMESYANRIRAQSGLETALFDAAKARLAETVDSPDDAARLVDGHLASQMHLLANKRNVAQRAVEFLSSLGSEGIPDPESDASEVDPDWLNHFAGYAEKASSENVRDLWARVLAGEVRHPGSFSLTTLRLLAEFDRQMASWFQEEAEFRVMGKYILRPDDLRGERLSRMLFLEEVGLIHNAANIGGVVHNFNPGSQGFAVLPEGDLCLRIHFDQKVPLKVIPMTRVGREIAAILPSVDPRSVFKRLATALHGNAKSIDICQILEKRDDQILLSNPIEILNPANASTS